MQTRNKANASHHISLIHASNDVVIKSRWRLTKSKLPSSVHGEISAPHCDSGTNRLKSFLFLLFLVTKDPEGLFLVYIGRSYTLAYLNKVGWRHMVPERTSERLDLENNIMSRNFKTLWILGTHRRWCTSSRYRGPCSTVSISVKDIDFVSLHCWCKRGQRY